MKPKMRRHPEVPRFHQRYEGSGVELICSSQDPSLRLKYGFARDDARGFIRVNPC